MFQDLIAAVRAGLREFTRRRWLKARARQFTLPF
jgi:hypothetical protein